MAIDGSWDPEEFPHEWRGVSGAAWRIEAT